LALNQVLTRLKDESGASQMKEVLKEIKMEAGVKAAVGTLVKEKSEGAFLSTWNEALGASGVTQTDATPGLAAVLATKVNVP
jgi:nucleosome binding factor SPN SPT16 subunit